MRARYTPGATRACRPFERPSTRQLRMLLGQVAATNLPVAFVALTRDEAAASCWRPARLPFRCRGSWWAAESGFVAESGGQQFGDLGRARHCAHLVGDQHGPLAVVA